MACEGVEVAVREPIPHARDVLPGRLGLCREDLSWEVLHCFVDLECQQERGGDRTSWSGTCDMGKPLEAVNGLNGLR